MRDELTFVRGAVATKDLVPVLTHFHIYGGHVQGGNGRITIDSPCEALAGIDITVPAEPFLRAVDACSGDPSMKLTQAGKLAVKRGSFRVTLPLADHGGFPVSTPDTEPAGIPEDLRPALRIVQPFVGEDASRAWATGALFTGDALYATNNVVLVKTELTGQPLEHPINIPKFAIEELVRINRVQTNVCVSDYSITFYFGEAWLKSQLLSTQWPDVDAMIPDTSDLPEVPEGLKQAVLKIRQFCPDTKFPVIHFKDNAVCTADGDMSAQMEGFELPDAGFHAEPLLAVLDKATHIDFSNYPGPCPFKGANFTGILIGVST